MQESWPFQKPVNKKQLKHYYEKIKEPMDLETMGKKVQQHAYHSRSEFFRDMELIWSNSKDFNGEQSEFTSKAKLLVDITKEKMYQAYNDDMARLVKIIGPISVKSYSRLAFFVKDYFGTIHILRTFFQGGWGGENCDFCLFSVPNLRLRRGRGRGSKKSENYLYSEIAQSIRFRSSKFNIRCAC